MVLLNHKACEFHSSESFLEIPIVLTIEVLLLCSKSDTSCCTLCFWSWHTENHISPFFYSVIIALNQYRRFYVTMPLPNKKRFLKFNIGSASFPSKFFRMGYFVEMEFLMETVGSGAAL
jgi:hypothetical protein